MRPLLLLRGVLLCVAAAAAGAHRPAVSGITGGAQFSSWDRALELPYVTASWSMNRLVECEHPFFWVKFTADPTAGLVGRRRYAAGQISSTSGRMTVQAAAGVPLLPALSDVRVSATVIGPGLEGGSTSDVNLAVRRILGMTSTPPGERLRAATFGPPRSVSDCEFVKTPVLLAAYNVSGDPPRCTFYEEYGKLYSYVVQDIILDLLIGETYYMAVYLDKATTGRYWFSVSDLGQSEDFATPYQAPQGSKADYSRVRFNTDNTPPGNCSTTRGHRA